MTNEELAVAIKAGDKDKLPELWAQVERFVSRQACKLITATGGSVAGQGDRIITTKPGLDGMLEYEDLYNSGYLAVVAAVDYFEADAGTSFIGILALCLKTAFADVGGYRGSKRDALRFSTGIDTTVPGTDDLTIADTLEDPNAAQDFQDVEEQLYQRQLSEALERALETLDDDERGVIRARYWEEKTLEELGGSRARTLESHALVKLRRPAVRRGLEQYIEARTPYYLRVGVEAFQSTGVSAVERIVFRREELRNGRDNC